MTLTGVKSSIKRFIMTCHRVAEIFKMKFLRAMAL
jgi:hypothetical protein